MDQREGNVSIEGFSGRNRTFHEVGRAAHDFAIDPAALVKVIDLKLTALLALPAFLIDEDAPAMPADIAAAFALTGFFLDRHVWAARGIDPPATRDPLVEGLTAGDE